MDKKSLKKRIKELEQKEAILNTIILKNKDLDRFIDSWSEKAKENNTSLDNNDIITLKEFSSFVKKFSEEDSAESLLHNNIIINLHLIKKSLESNPNCDSGYLFECCANATEIVSETIKELERFS